MLLNWRRCEIENTLTKIIKSVGEIDCKHLSKEFTHSDKEGNGFKHLFYEEKE